MSGRHREEIRAVTTPTLPAAISLWFLIFYENERACTLVHHGKEPTSGLIDPSIPEPHTAFHTLWFVQHTQRNAKTKVVGAKRERDRDKEWWKNQPKILVLWERRTRPKTKNNFSNKERCREKICGSMRVSSAPLFFWPVDNIHHHYLTTGIPPFPISSSSSNSLRSSYMTTWSQISSKSADFALELCMHSLVLLFIQNNNGKAPGEKKKRFRQPSGSTRG